MLEELKVQLQQILDGIRLIEGLYANDGLRAITKHRICEILKVKLNGIVLNIGLQVLPHYNADDTCNLQRYSEDNLVNIKVLHHETACLLQEVKFILPKSDKYSTDEGFMEDLVKLWMEHKTSEGISTVEKSLGLYREEFMQDDS